MRAGIESIKGEYLTRAFQGEDTGSIHRRRDMRVVWNDPWVPPDGIRGSNACPYDIRRGEWLHRTAQPWCFRQPHCWTTCIGRYVRLPSKPKRV